MDIGGPVSCNGSRKVSEWKYQDFLVHFKKDEWGHGTSLKSQVVFLALSYEETGEAIRQLLKDTLYATMGLDFD